MEFEPIGQLPDKTTFLKEICYSDFYSKFDIKYLTSEEDKQKYDISKIKIARYYLIVIELSLFINFILNTLTSKELMDVFVNSPIDQVRFGMIMLVLIFLVMSYYV